MVHVDMCLRHNTWDEKGDERKDWMAHLRLAHVPIAISSMVSSRKVSEPSLGTHLRLRGETEQDGPTHGESSPFPSKPFSSKEKKKESVATVSPDQGRRRERRFPGFGNRTCDGCTQTPPSTEQCVQSGSRAQVSTATTWDSNH